MTVTAYLELTGDLTEYSGTVTGTQIAFTDVPAGQYKLFIHAED